MGIFMEAPQQRKGRSVDALKKAGEHPAVIIAVARLFWGERKIEKTRQWMQNAITADADWGDAWGWWLKFEMQHGEQVSRRVFIANHAGTARRGRREMRRDGTASRTGMAGCREGPDESGKVDAGHLAARRVAPGMRRLTYWHVIEMSPSYRPSGMHKIRLQLLPLPGPPHDVTFATRILINVQHASPMAQCLPPVEDLRDRT